MDTKTKEFRLEVLEHIKLLASASLQSRYEKEVPAADVPAELFSRFCDDLFHPNWQTFLDAFTADEIRDLAVLYGLLHVASQEIAQFNSPSVADLRKLPAWRSVMAYAKELDANLRR